MPPAIRRERVSNMATALQNRLDIENGRAVDCFQSLHLNAAQSVDTENHCAVESNRVGPIGRTSCEHARKRISQITSRMHLQNRSLRFMEPRQNPNVLARFDARKAVDECRIDLEPSVRRTVPCLTRSAGAFLESGTYVADGKRLEAFRNIHMKTHQQTDSNSG